jgi:hypothetical protein
MQTEFGIHHMSAEIVAETGRGISEFGGTEGKQSGRGAFDARPRVVD